MLSVVKSSYQTSWRPWPDWKSHRHRKFLPFVPFLNFCSKSSVPFCCHSARNKIWSKSSREFDRLRPSSIDFDIWHRNPIKSFWTRITRKGADQARCNHGFRVVSISKTYSQSSKKVGQLGQVPCFLGFFAGVKLANLTNFILMFCRNQSHRKLM